MDYDEETRQMSDDYGIDIEKAEQARELVDEYALTRMMLSSFKSICK